MRKTSPSLALFSSLALFACSTELLPEAGDYVKGTGGKADASAEAVFLDFEFDGELLTTQTFNLESVIEDQLLYTIGHLNGDRGVGRLDKLEISNLVTSAEGSKTRVKYHARLPVAWGHKNSPIPSSYDLRVPLDVTSSSLESFTEKYSHTCVDFGAHDVTSGSMWYYYRPNRSGCSIDAADVIDIQVDVSLSEINTTGKYPEYHKVWEDEVLNVVAVFGKYEDGATTSADAGISAYNQFVRTTSDLLRNSQLETVPAEFPVNPGIELPDITFRGTLPGGKRIEVVALLVDNVRTAGPAFDARYAQLSGRADLIVYNGHAGLGANIRALARKGQWLTGQYVIVFMNGCDTYAYVDSALADAHSAVNVDDPVGTKYVDIVTNALPSFFNSMPNATLALIKGLMAVDEPRTYETMFLDIDRSEVVLVSGEQDNEYVPGFPGGGEDPDEDWDGMSESGTVAAGAEDHYQTPTLPAGSYVFDLSGSGDADLYVRVGLAPTEESFDCRPFKSGSIESCRVELPSPAPIHVMVRGWATSSDYELEGSNL